MNPTMPEPKRKQNGEISASKSIHDAFVLFDVDHDGKITEKELNNVLKLLGIKESASEVKKMIAGADANQNGTVEYKEFILMMNRYSELTSSSPETEMLEVFRVFDKNKDSFIDHDEIKQTMNYLGITVSDADVQAMIKEADADHNNLVDFEEFKRMVKRMQQPKSKK